MVEEERPFSPRSFHSSVKSVLGKKNIKERKTGRKTDSEKYEKRKWQKGNKNKFRKKKEKSVVNSGNVRSC